MVARDTSRDAHAAQLRVYARMSPARRVELAVEMSEMAREIAIEGVRERDPKLSRQAAREVVLRRLLGGDLFDAAWPGSRLADT